MKKYLSKIHSWILYLFLVFIIFLLLFSGFRYLFFHLNTDAALHLPESLYTDALTLGISYDTMTVSYLLVIPALAFFISMFADHHSIWFKRAITIYFSIVFFIVLLSCSADIPFYEFCGSRLSTAIVMWADTPGTMLQFVFENPSYRPFLLLVFFGMILSIILLLFLQKKLLDAFTGETRKISFGKKIIVCLCITFFLLIGIRGGWRVRPIGIKDAFVSNYPFVNLLPLNPLHSFFDSMEKINLDYLEEDVAINNAQRFLKVPNGTTERSPMARKIEFADSDLSIKPNIVLILMESMSAEMTGLSSNRSFTPIIDSLSKNSISFSRFYTSGIHTCNGLYGVLHSMPSVPGEHPLSNIYTVNNTFYGMANVLKEKGYSTHFFCTHYEEFDNMGFFLRNNGFDDFFSRKDYPDAPDESSFGVSDETLYEFAFKKLNDFSKKGIPFFTSLLTISTHEPPILPKATAFQTKSKIPFEQVYEYADWALGNFMARCSKEKWYNNTIFVFVADHGCNMPSPHEIPLSYHHSPFIIHAPWLIKEAKVIDDLAIQMDVFPTVMHLLKLPYINNTLGINLFKEKRPFAFFCKDYLVGCLDKKHFMIIRKFGGETLHKYIKGEGVEDVLEEQQALSDSMKIYTYSMLQTAQWMLENKKTSAPDLLERKR